MATQANINVLDGKRLVWLRLWWQSRHCLWLALPTLLDIKGFSFKLGLNMVSPLLDWLSETPGLIQILIFPSRQTVRTDSCVNITPERGSVCTRWATSGEIFGTSRMLGAGCSVPTGSALSQWDDWLPVLYVGEPPGGHRRKGTTISSISRSHRSNCVSCTRREKYKHHN